jgi:hypothetical protein
LSSFRGRLGNIEGFIDNLDRRLNDIPGRISNVRRGNYLVSTHLERDQKDLEDDWRSREPYLREDLRMRMNEIISEISRFERGYGPSGLQSLENIVASLGSKVSGLESHVSGSMSEYEVKRERLEEELRVAESTVELTSQSSFPWKEGESPVYAVYAKDMDNDLEGIITLTNLRFIFESEKEVVLKKTLFFATEKKTVREVVVEEPIGVIEELTKGRVGFLAGHGLFVSFKPRARLAEMKFDTKGDEADEMIKFYNFIVSGEAERELESIKDEESLEKKEEPRPLVCELCGAPYTEEVYRGQTSVQCKYCGAVITV